MPNRRILFSNQVVAFALPGVNTFQEGHGVQSVGITTNFNLEQAFELSNQSIYENIEGSPDVQVSLSKVLDGYCPLYLLASKNAAATSLVARGAVASTFGLAIHDDTVTYATGYPVRECIISGALIASVGYNFSTDGNFTEDLSLAAYDKIWKSGVGTFLLTGFLTFNNDVPLSYYGSGGVNRREDFLYTSATLTGVGGSFDANGIVNNQNVSVLPPEIDGVNSSGLVTLQSDGTYSANIQSITVSADFGREDVFQLGRKAFYAKFANPLIQVSTAITTQSTYWDNISCNNAGIYAGGNNLINRTIKIRIREGLYIDLGTKNKLASVEYGGGDAGGGNVQTTYNYTNFNDMNVAHPMDCTTALRISGPQ